MKQTKIQKHKVYKKNLDKKIRQNKLRKKFGHFFVTDTHTAPIIYKSLFGTSSTVFIRTLSRWGPMCDNNEAFEEEKAKDEESDSA